MRRWALLFALCARPLAAFAEGDVVFKAMEDELKRTMSRLQMNRLGKATFASYLVTDSDRLELEGVFGALRDPNSYRARDLKVDLRMGGKTFDQTHYVGKDYWRYRPFTEEMPVEDDYDALRFALWGVTDSAYKHAVEKLSQKKAYQKSRNITEELPDLSPDPAASSSEPSAEKPFDRPLWEQRVKELSAIFKEYPAIQSSSVGVYWTRRTQRFLDSEGRRVLKPADDYELFVQASAQAPDGLALADRRRVIRKAMEDLPPIEELRGQVKSLAEDLTALAKAPVMEPYIGPVLLQGQAAAEFFNQLLARNISFSRPLWVEDERLKENYLTGELAGRMGLRVVSPLLGAVDDPGPERFDGTPLIGHYKVDDEGIPAQRLSIIEKGLLRDVPMSRSPIKERKLSNGHGRASTGEFIGSRIGSLFIKPESALSEADLKKELLKQAEDYGLSYGLIIRQIAEEDYQEKDEILAAPIVVVKAYVADGHEEYVRNARFSGITMRALRDITAASDKPFVYNFYQLGRDRGNRGQVQASIVCPSVLVSEMELNKTEKKPEKPPYLKHPYFAVTNGREEEP